MAQEADSVAVVLPTEQPSEVVKKPKKAKSDKIRPEGMNFKGWHVGFLGGATYSFPSISEFAEGGLQGGEPAWGGRAGMDVLYGFTKSVALTFGVNYSMRDVRAKFTRNVDGQEYILRHRFNVSSLNVPLAVKFHFPRMGRRFSLSPMAGGNLEVNLGVVSNRDSVETNTYGTFIVRHRDSNLDRINRVNFSVFGGLALDIRFNTTFLSIGPSYHYGLMDLFAQPGRFGIGGRTDYLTIDLRYYL